MQELVTTPEKKERGIKALIVLLQKKVDAYLESPLKMLAVAPPDEEDYLYGDLVPLSFLNLAWCSIPKRLRPANWSGTKELISKLLYAQQVNGLWAFDAGQLITAVDSAFILRSLDDSGAVKLLEQFSDGAGGYFPQMFTEGREAHKMTIDARTRHWCQADYSLLLQIYVLRRRANLPIKNEVKLVRDGFRNRSGLYLANPFFTDWLLSDLISHDDNFEDLGLDLTTIIHSAIRRERYKDFFDPYLSISLAVSSMCRLNYWSDEISAALDYLVASVDKLDSEPPCFPFYSSMIHNWQDGNFIDVMALKLKDEKKLLNKVNGEQHRLTLYKDQHNLIRLSLAMIAICESLELDKSTALLPEVVEIPDAYKCKQHAEYITEYALPTYVNTEKMPNVRIAENQH